MLLVTGAALWVLPMGLLILAFGWDGTLTQMGWFFTKAALLTFGAPTRCCRTCTRAL